jgi:methyl-accepting chemotaxis protein
MTSEQAVDAQLAFGKECQPAFTKLGQELMAVVAEVQDRALKESDNLTAVSNGVSRTTVAAVVGGFLLVAAIGFFAVRSWIVTPLGGIARVMQVLANGELGVDVTGADRKDEVGAMAKAVQVFKDNALKARELAADAENTRRMAEDERQRTAETERRRAAEMDEATGSLGEGLSHLAKGDLTYQLTRPFAAEFEGLRENFNAAVNQLHDTLISVARSSSTIDGGSRELSVSAGELSQRTERQAASLEETRPRWTRLPPM